MLSLPASNALTTNYRPLLDWSNSTVPVGTIFDHYEVQVDDDADFPNAEIDHVVAAPVTNSSYIPDTDLAANTKFYWRVRAYNTLGQYGSWSLVRYFRTAITPPAMISPLNGASTSVKRPVFDWDDPAGATGYTIQISRNNTITSLVGTYNVTLSTYTPAANLPVGTYYWRVQARGPNGPSLWCTGRSIIITP